MLKERHSAPWSSSCSRASPGHHPATGHALLCKHFRTGQVHRSAECGNTTLVRPWNNLFNWRLYNLNREIGEISEETVIKATEIKLNAISQTVKDKYHAISLTWGIWKTKWRKKQNRNKLTDTKNKLMVARWEEGSGMGEKVKGLQSTNCRL